MYGIDAGEGLKSHWLLAVNVRFALRPGSETRLNLVKAKSPSGQSVAICGCNILLKRRVGLLRLWLPNSIYEL